MEELREVGDVLDAVAVRLLDPVPRHQSFSVLRPATLARYLLTAGHCNGAGSAMQGTGSMWDHNWNANYILVQNANQNLSKADAALISIPDEDASNLVVLNQYDVGAVFGYAPIDMTGGHRCQTGYVSGYKCGLIVGNNVSYSETGVLITNLTSTTYTRAPGDSGAAVVEENTIDPDGVHRLNAAGVHSGFKCSIGGFDCYAVYSKINNVTAALNVSLLLGYNEVRIQGANSAKCADVVGGSGADGTQMQQWDCNSNPQQHYQIRPYGATYQIRPLNSITSCLDVPGGTHDPVVLQIYQCSQVPQQFWTLTQAAGNSLHFNISPVSFLSACMDVTGGSQTNGTRLQQYNCNGNLQQWWHFING